MKIHREKIITVGQAILTVAALTTFVGFAAVVPGTLRVLKSFGFDKKALKRREHYINDSLERLLEKGLLAIAVKNGIKSIKITATGEKKLRRFETEGLLENKPKKWDGKYSVVIFDIKENNRLSRDDLRYMLLRFGFVKLQNSVWVYPYPCKGAINLLKKYLEVKDEVIYMTVESIENDNWLRKKFDLPKS